jgi:hypothetical protein
MRIRRFGLVLPLALVTLPTTTFGQARDPNNLLARPARLLVRDTLLQDAIRALGQTSGVSIAFSPDFLPEDFRVSCPCRDSTIAQALQRILRGTNLGFEATRTLIRIVPPPSGLPAPPATGTLTGRILEAGTGAPVANAMVQLPDGRGAHSDRQGRFRLSGVPPGEYELTATGMGWRGTTVDGVQVRRNETTVLGITLTPVAIPLAEMVVAPSTYGILQDPLAPTQTMSREEIRALPQMGEDLFRVAERLPGITTNDFTARLFVRGSRANEVVTLMDGLELFDPYHLKQWEAVLSILDVETVGNVDLITGGFPAEYGDRTAGVFSLNSVEPRTDGVHTSVGLSFMNLSLRNEGGFDDGRGSWLFTARRGFMDIVFGIANVEGDFHPAYYDVFGKVGYEIRPGHELSARILHAGDDLRGSDDDDKSRHDDLYGSSYLWLTWDSEISEGLSSRTILSGSRVFKDRHAQDFEDDGATRILDVNDEQETRLLGLKSDWSWEYSPRVIFKAGLDLRQGWADYEYDLWRSDWYPNFTDPAGPAFFQSEDTVAIATNPSGLTTALYVGNRLQVTESLITDVGLRYSHASYAGEGQLRPRLSAAYQLSPQTTLRAAWGHYAQPQGLHELQIADGDTLFYPTQEAEHRILGIEHILLGKVNLRLEAFQRLTSDPFPEYRNLVDKVEAVWEEGPGDRVGVLADRRKAQGLEVLAKGPLGHWAGWSASYAYSRAEDRVEGAWIPRPHDQRHATQLHLTLRPAPGWAFSAAWQARSGWPASEQTFEIVTLATGDPTIRNRFGELNGTRLPGYRRLDLRASKRFELPRGQIYLDLDLFNALGRENPQSLDYDLHWWDPYRRTLSFGSQVEEQIPRLVALGLRWEF